MLESLPNDDGIVPVNEFVSRKKYTILTKLPREEGMVPVKQFICILRFVSFVNFPREDGIGPIKELALTRKNTKLFKSPSCVGKLPESRLF
jgi:hypothetical protein